ncbi:folate-binding protein [uncultured Jannaschia sp.]|uniref:CAF17-like 4Fe-4S cluster assembly/insertion protein YgfZ n=1 Tax=uncultured Jannaschia sp. TaxID=293347 RepID=UPI0026046D78|nr:folate-binding protein [uncultured Jannaschia sp.]
MTRSVLRISGPDRETFLHGLITRDVPDTGLGYAALLTPQGKYLADFLTFRDADAFYLDVAADLAAGLAQRLAMYRLRAKVEIAVSDLVPTRHATEVPGAMADPRPGMGWHSYDGTPGDDTDWDARRVEHMVPETGIELIPNETFILEMGFERLGGVDFRKGCYVGQEIVARMKHKTELRKGLARIAGTDLVQGAEITAAGKAAGTVHTVSGDRALAYLRFDRVDGMEAGGVPVTLDAR